MSERNIELTRGYIAAFNARDIEAIITYCDPSIEYHSVWAVVGGAVYHGTNGLRRWHRDLAEAWGDEIRLEPEAYFDLGEPLLVRVVELRSMDEQTSAPSTKPDRVCSNLADWEAAISARSSGRTVRSGS